MPTFILHDQFFAVRIISLIVDAKGHRAMTPGRRPERLAEQIREEVGMIICGELEDPRVELVTVTHVKVTTDLRHARVFVDVEGTEPEVNGALDALRHAAGFIRQQLGAALRMKRTPELHFVYDEVERRAARVEKLLDEETGRVDVGGDSSAPSDAMEKDGADAL